MPIDDDTLQFLEEAILEKHPAFFSADKVKIVFQTKILSINGERIKLFNSVPPEHIKKVVQSSVFSTQCGMVRFSSNQIESDGCHIVFSLNGINVIEETRKAERFPLLGSKKVMVQWLNPYDKETILNKYVMDMSSSGLSFRSHLNSGLYHPGTIFKNMQILIDGKVHNRENGTVVYSRCFLSMEGKSYFQVGVRFNERS